MAPHEHRRADESVIRARGRDRHASLRRASTVCVVDKGFDGQQPKRSGAHHLGVMSSTRGTLMEVSRSSGNRVDDLSPARRPARRWRRQYEVWSPRESLLQDLTCDIGGTGFDPVMRCDRRTLAAVNCSSRSELAIQVGSPHPSAAGTGRRQSAVPFTPWRACARPELQYSGLAGWSSRR